MQGNTPVPKGVAKYEDLQTKKGVTVFVIEFEGGAPLKKRYSEFKDLHASLPEPLRKKMPTFPPKTGIAKASTDVKLYRCKAFDSLVKEMWADPNVRALKEVQLFFQTTPIRTGAASGAAPSSVVSQDEKDNLFEFCGNAKRRGDIGGKVFAKALAPLSMAQAKKCVCYLLVHKYIETKTPGPGFNGDTIKEEEETDNAFIFWIYGGGTYFTSGSNNYHYYFGVEMKKTGEIRLIDCTDEQWDDIVKEYGPVGRGPPVDQIAGSDDRAGK
eukprot:TRINITY_DN11411_c0_g1_i1.p1 TRINITY_DN11411_c0_g1~~TRINITY_DN11411_c0_g1_i1.p1  ORF type:complete len:270 (+),score=59.55 TRINITY_DN11411_c0_g1_i1:39-848(+)